MFLPEKETIFHFFSPIISNIQQACLSFRHNCAALSALDYRTSSPGLRPGWQNCVVFLAKKCCSCSASLHPGVWRETRKLSYPTKKYRYLYCSTAQRSQGQNLKTCYWSSYVSVHICSDHSLAHEDNIAGLHKYYAPKSTGSTTSFPGSLILPPCSPQAVRWETLGMRLLEIMLTALGSGLENSRRRKI